MGTMNKEWRKYQAVFKFIEQPQSYRQLHQSLYSQSPSQKSQFVANLDGTRNTKSNSKQPSRKEVRFQTAAPEAPEEQPEEVETTKKIPDVSSVASIQRTMNLFLSSPQ